jgi:hypothetical protein
MRGCLKRIDAALEVDIVNTADGALLPAGTSLVEL